MFLSQLAKAALVALVRAALGALGNLVFAWWNGNEDTKHRDFKKVELAAACKNTIEAGFASSDLGAVFTYPSTVLDQLIFTHCNFF